jgi:hypothetical protein
MLFVFHEAKNMHIFALKLCMFVLTMRMFEGYFDDFFSEFQICPQHYIETLRRIAVPKIVFLK